MSVPAPGAGLIVVNPTAHRLRDPGRQERLVAELRRSVLERTGRAPVLIAVGDQAAMRERVARVLEGDAGLVVVVGGDGTVRDVVELVGPRRVPLTIVPVGTANLFAAALRIPLNPERAARLTPDLVPRQVDLGTIEFGTASGHASQQRVFTVGAGIGFDARVMAAVSTKAKRRIGRYAYFMAAAGELARSRPVRLHVEADGMILDLEAFEVLVANSGDLIPGLVRPALPVRPADGLLDVFIVSGQRRLDAVRGAAESIVRRAAGRSRSGRSYRLRARLIRVEAGGAAPVEVDGDVVGSGWFEARAVPQALTVLVPRAGRP